MVRNDESKKGCDGMAIERVTVELGNNTDVLQKTAGSNYEGNIKAPEIKGKYYATVKAYDDAGNISVAKSKEIEVTIWRPPKVNWTPNDRFNYVDYNRIKNNLQWLYEKAVELYKPFPIADMGEDIESYTAYWPVAFFNAWEQNLDTINKNMFVQNYGNKQVFYENGTFIQWNELNRIEGATLRMREILDSQEAGLKRLSFRLGNFKGVRV